jgi:tetratricopeptide (TPR) repeat protein
MQQQTQPNQPTPKQVFEDAYKMLRLGDVFEASKRAAKLRSHFPEDIPTLALHGFVLAKMGLHPQALSDLIKAAQLTEQALMNDDGENAARPRIVDQLIRLSVQICRSSVEINEMKAAEEAIDQAYKWDPERGDAAGAKAEMLSAMGKDDEALKLIDEALAENFDSLPLILARAKVLFAMESADESKLEGLISELNKEAEVSGLSVIDLGDLLRALGTAHDRLGQFDESFNAFRRAAKLRRGTFDPRAHTMMTTKLIHEWNAAAINKLVRPSLEGDKYVLLLGAPQSGVEELGALLNQFEDVHVLGPLETLSSATIRFLNARQGVLRPAPFEPTKLRGNQLKEAGEGYIGALKPLMPQTAQRGIDTHPLNVPLAGAAAAILPGLSIIMCRREPMEATLATYCDAMVGNHPYAGDLLSTAGFVADCNRLMDHWAKELADESVGANIVQVEYNDLVADPKKTAAKVARDIGLDARATSIKQLPTFARGPGNHIDSYTSYTKVVTDMFSPMA